MKLLLAYLFIVIFSVQGLDDYYYVSLPNAFMVEKPNNIFVQTSKSILLTLETKEEKSGFIVNSGTHFVEEGIKLIQYTVPFVGSVVGPSLSLTIKAANCTTKSTCLNNPDIKYDFINETRKIMLKSNNYIIFAETSKPIYKPGELVKFRFFPIYPTNLKWQVNSIGKQWEIKYKNMIYEKVLKMNTSDSQPRFDLIIIENPDGVRMGQWRNKSITEAMNLSFQLTKDPVLGKWKVTANLKENKEVIYFVVKHYVLPRFIVDINPPKQILYSDKNIEFEVCSKYSTGKLMKANIVGKFCVKNYKFNKCFSFERKLVGKSKCVLINVDTKILGFGKNKYWYMRSEIIVTVTEADTTLTVKRILNGPTVSSVKYNIEFIGKPYFKPSLPYFGQLKLMQPGGDAMPHTNITISAKEYRYGFGFELNYTSDVNGIINFIIPSININQSLSVTFSSQEKKNDINMRAPRAFQTLHNFESTEKKYLQIIPPFTDNNFGFSCPGKLKLKVIINEKIESMNIFAQIFARGEIVALKEFKPKLMKCKSRDDYLGHFDCVGDDEIKCKPGWKGDNCIQPICEDCAHGLCLSPGRCSCSNGWRGDKCDECIIAPYCKNGVCKRGNDCLCLPGWTGYKCDRKAPKRHKYYTGRSFTRPMTTPTIITVNKTKVTGMRRTVFEVPLEIDINSQFGPDVHVIIYWFSKSGEFIADNLELKDVSGTSSSLRNNCSQAYNDNAKFEIDKEVVRPGDRISVTLQTRKVPLVNSSQSCALRIVDTAVAQFGGSSNANLDYLVDKLTSLTHQIINIRGSYRRYDCINFKRRFKRRSIRPPYGMNSYDAYQLLRESGIIPISNIRTVNKICKNYFQGRMNIQQFSIPGAPSSRKRFKGNTKADSGGGGSNDKNKSKNKVIKEVKQKIRSLFPESWIFDYYPNSSSVQYNYTVPDSITTWKADAFCMTNKGVWIGPSRYLKTILPFYADIYVPYSIKRDETLKLPVKLFNYLDECYEIRAVILMNTSQIQLKGVQSFTTCVCGNEIKTLFFNIRPIMLGKLNITIMATSSYSSFCSNATIDKNKNKLVSYQDGIRRQLLVVAEGVENELSYSELFCTKNETIGIKKEYSVPSGSKLVKDSLRSYLVFNGDVMGQSLDNLGRLVKMPYGCGEQNMAALVPSIYVLQYITSMNINKMELKIKAEKYIQQGFKRQLKYKHKDGSFSAFGEGSQRDKVNGSTWLTAFVAQSFRQAYQFVDLDGGELVKDAEKYLIKMQAKDGCFEEHGKLFSSVMAGGGDKSNSAATDRSLLTAYVLLSLHGSKSIKFRKDDAIKCVMKPVESANVDNYRLALSAYVLALYKKEDLFTSSVIKRLLASSTIKGTRIRYWSAKESKTNPYSSSANVETTGYAFLALEKYGESMSKSLPTIIWLSGQRNSMGGYYSTQDTVVALCALASFARNTGAGLFDAIDFTVHLKHNDDIIYSNKTKITKYDRLVTRRIPLGSKNISYVSFTANGTGCLSVQIQSLFNERRYYSAKDTFGLSVTQTQRTNCSTVSLSLCSSYLRRDKSSGMVLVSLALPSGFGLSNIQKLQLLNQAVSPLRRIEIESDRFQFYYDGFSYNDEEQRCVNIDITRLAQIDNLKPAVARITDYYNPEKYVDKIYTINCTKDKKPYQPPPPTCPLCPDKIDQSQFITFLTKLCIGSQGIIQPQPNSKYVTYFQPLETTFYEWTVQPEPISCSCSINKTLVAISTNYIGLYNEKLYLTNKTNLVTLEYVYKLLSTDITSQCRLANNLYKLIKRIRPESDASILSTNRNSGNSSCSNYIFPDNLYDVVDNVTALLCKVNRSLWLMDVSKNSNDTQTVTLTLTKNDNKTQVINAVGRFPSLNCFSFYQLQNNIQNGGAVKLNMFISDDRDLIGELEDNENQLLLDETIEIVERSIFTRRKYLRCD